MLHHHIAPFLRIVFWLGLGSLLWTGCQSGPSAKHYAQRLCDCSETFSKAPIQLQAGTIDQATFDQLKADHEACMGEDDPLQDLKDDPKALQAFKADFLLQLEQQCPAIARNLGY